MRGRRLLHRRRGEHPGIHRHPVGAHRHHAGAVGGQGHVRPRAVRPADRHRHPPGRGTAAGQVTILANGAPACTATLASGTAKCAAGPGQLKPGSYQLTAAYSGDPAYGPSTEPITTALTLSAAKLKAGHEQAGHLTVTVKPQASGVPAGKVTVKAGATVLCAITLTSAKGTCTLAASKLRPGTCQLTATYPGTTPYAASTSPGKTLTITR